MERIPQIIEPAKVHRPNDSGVDLPAGKAANELDRSDYKVVEILEEQPAAKRDEPTGRAPEQRS